MYLCLTWIKYEQLQEFAMIMIWIPICDLLKKNCYEIQLPLATVDALKALSGGVSLRFVRK